MNLARVICARRSWLVLGAVLATLAGCATVDKQPEPTRLVWPPPPLKPRIEFVRSVVSGDNIEKDTTFSERVVAFLAGGEKPPANRVAEPMGVAVSDDGQRLYVSDYAQMAVFVFDFDRKTFTKLGEKEALGRPVGLALDGDGRLYVVEQWKKLISIFDAHGNKVGSFTEPSLERPTGIAIDRRHGRIYVADTSHTKSEKHEVKIFDMNHRFIGAIGGEKGDAPGRFLFPTYLAVDDDGHLYVTDTLNSRVQEFDADGTYVKSFGQRGNAWGMFDKPKGVALDSFGNVYVADSGWSNVQIFNKKGQVLLFFGGRGPIPGMLKNPTALAIDKNNRIYVADYLNHRVEVYQLVNTTSEDSFVDPTAKTRGGDLGQKNVAAESTTGQEKTAKGGEVK